MQTEELSLLLELYEGMQSLVYVPTDGSSLYVMQQYLIDKTQIDRIASTLKKVEELLFERLTSKEIIADNDLELLEEIKTYPIPTIDLDIATEELPRSGGRGSQVIVRYIPDQSIWSSQIYNTNDEAGYLAAVSKAIHAITVVVKKEELYQKRYGTPAVETTKGIKEDDLSIVVAKLQQRVELLERANTMR